MRDFPKVLQSSWPHHTLYTPYIFEHHQKYRSLNKLYIILNYRPPLAITGIRKVPLISLIMSQSHGPVNYYFCSFVLPWTVIMYTPAYSIFLTRFRVSFTEGRILIFAVTGTFRFWFNSFIIWQIRSVSVNK